MRAARSQDSGTCLTALTALIVLIAITGLPDSPSYCRHCGKPGQAGARRCKWRGRGGSSLGLLFLSHSKGERVFAALRYSHDEKFMNVHRKTCCAVSSSAPLQSTHHSRSVLSTTLSPTIATTALTITVAGWRASLMRAATATSSSI